ncbi:glycosyltransferase family 2 protein [Gregarina niphandrodes]|uniref:Glycosyltransferase family 2 protein n=1 Tax=Gregarina niphandrodes TaxID=110365 RepID=A0A023B0X3_GRENI|nr:glycosyltransferase family 2 protein [Gregarina niphandrodes]EZG46013.1 glycosyltransferase family 2 protein [Gregarina niphandrodes]|eukprot:XP_011132387.1 glycosyltransferase family 2 protein [Gregarina niphandrodes]
MGRQELRRWRLQWFGVVGVVGVLFVFSYWTLRAQREGLSAINEKIFMGAHIGGVARFGVGRSVTSRVRVPIMSFDTGFRSFVEPDDGKLERLASGVPAVDGQPMLPGECDAVNLLASGASAATALSASGTGKIGYRPRYRLIAVAKVGNEMPYILEWLDFHIHQGFDHFVLYIDDSPFDIGSNYLQTLRLLPEYYAQLGYPGDLIEVKTIGGSLGGDGTGGVVEGLFDSKMNYHRLTQQTLIKHAFEKYKHDTEWIMHFDVDEFIHPIPLLQTNMSETSTAGDNDGADNDVLGSEEWLRRYPQDQGLSEWQMKLRAVEREGRRFDPRRYGDGRGKLSGDEWTLARYLQNLYVDPNSFVAESYQMGYLSGIYVFSAPFGIGDAYWFSPIVNLVRNEANGQLELLYAPSVPAGDLGDDTTPQGDIEADARRMNAFINYLTGLEQLDDSDPKKLQPLLSFYEAFKNTTFDHPQWQGYPFQLLRQTHKTLSAFNGDSIVEAAKHHVNIWPECKPMLET